MQRTWTIAMCNPHAEEPVSRSCLLFSQFLKLAPAGHRRHLQHYNLTLAPSLGWWLVPRYEGELSWVILSMAHSDLDSWATERVFPKYPGHLISCRPIHTCRAGRLKSPGVEPCATFGCGRVQLIEILPKKIPTTSPYPYRDNWIRGASEGNSQGPRWAWGSRASRISGFCLSKDNPTRLG